ncbi:MAG: glycerol-3-phosphate dehydrogenase/oxidase [Pseudomonadota bacterium]
MKRDLKAMAGAVHDILVIGGGIAGAAIAWDAALRGLRVALVEKGDFSHATSAASSKLLHGGLRYLRQGKLALVRQSLRERRIWGRIAPHMVAPLAFLIPVYGARAGEAWLLRLGLSLYDALALDRNWGVHPDKKLARHRRLSPAATLSLAPYLAREGLRGGFVYHDCQMHAPERLALECLLGAAALGAGIANYAEALDFVLEDGGVGGALVRDRLTGAEYPLRARLTINAAGPWADMVARWGSGDDAAPRLMRSKGIHLITPRLHGPLAVALQAEGRHFFLLPWRGATIIGTTDSLFAGSPDEVGVSEADIAGLLDLVNRTLPAARLTRGDIAAFYAGLRPLVDADNAAAKANAQSYDASRAAEIIDHEAGGGQRGLISALGGKWTTARHVAEKVVDLVVAKGVGGGKRPCRTAITPLWAGATGRFDQFAARALAKHQGWPAPVIHHLTRTYGARYEEVLGLAAADAALRAPLAEGLPEMGAQIVHGVRHEQAVMLEDVLFRRTGLCALGPPGDASIARAAAIMASARGWDQAETRRQIDAAQRRFATVEAT